MQTAGHERLYSAVGMFNRGKSFTLRGTTFSQNAYVNVGLVQIAAEVDPRDADKALNPRVVQVICDGVTDHSDYHS